MTETDYSKVDPEGNAEKLSTRKILPVNLTSYDFLKTIALILMIIDHVGIYFFPDENWFRIFGRLCVPIWFFLIGYARTRDIPFKVLFGAALLISGTFVAGEVIFPVTILITLMIGRYYIDTWMKAASKGGEAMAGLFFMLLILTFPSAFAFEYGTLGLLFTVFGALCRYKQDYKEHLPQGFTRQIMFFALASFFAFTLLQITPMKILTMGQFAFICIGMASVYFMLNRFQPAELPNLTKALPSFVTGLLKLTGRHTLEIYVAHLLIFKGVAMYLYPEKYQFLQWNWTHENTMKFLEFLFSTGS